MITGVVGHIKWYDYTAAAINGYAVGPVYTRNPRGGRTWDGRTWTMSATIVLADPFKMAQRPLRFVAKHRKGAWCWPIESLIRGGPDGSHLEARLGPQRIESRA